INTVKISASFEHISRADIEKILDKYNNNSILLPFSSLQSELSKLPWAKNIEITRIWPDTLKIMIEEKQPIAIWKNSFITSDGSIIAAAIQDIQKQDRVHSLPKLSGPDKQYQEVLQNYEKLSKLLSAYGLRAESLNLRDNQSWDLYLADGVVLRLGKKNFEKRVLGFCKAYSTELVDRPEKMTSVDLRYPHGMAVQWNVSNKQREDNG
ncbi:MAG: FtsQ-type POTRA domain-containing protein, partial [Chitinophagia bacterium]|nr:FtsQ-type POTRA domain-containing protein [Chitinophagia bacterium]